MDQKYLSEPDLYLEKHNNVLLFKGFCLKERLLHKKRKITQKIAHSYETYFNKYSISEYAGPFKVEIEFKTTKLYYRNQLIQEYNNTYYLGSDYCENVINCIFNCILDELTVDSFCFEHKQKINDFNIELKEYYKTIVADKRLSLHWLKKNCINF